MIGILSGVVIGAAATYSVGRIQRKRQARQVEQRIAERYAALHPPATRAALPNAVIPLPQDQEDFEVLAMAVGDCLSLLSSDGRVPTQAALRDCILDSIYPDFPWPPVAGDAPSANLMWMIANHEAGKALQVPEGDGG